MKHVVIHDPTLRDGQHAVRHRLGSTAMRRYAEAADAARIPVVEVGHGNGLGASSLQVGPAAVSDDEMLSTVREALRHSRMGVFMLPGWGTSDDLRRAVAHGADVVRIGVHASEVSLAERHLGFLRDAGAEAHCVLMMSHMPSPGELAEQAALAVAYGAQAVGIMDSAGHFLPADVTARIGAITAAVGSVPVIFHGHNNLGMAVANSVAAADAGARIVDGCARGFGAGAGNTQLEVLVPVLERSGFTTGIDLYALLDAADLAERELMPAPPVTASMSIVSGLAGVFSGFKHRVVELSDAAGVDPRDVFFELGRRQAIAGQEDLIVDVVAELSGSKADG
ncbi:4-hydroxy-2-oxovalerate aldolase [Streptomyces somaliensis]|uniref:4-hydroxy-2-oxovalerate aldolase n=1 Tax=Streptomyces somaliensis (strain ATCC 33201 / DSM 40738 / JCM 12659 / KCTC 9044 / NCTC 11332 / NRRL B-12077 / IP 733) TaxID=1134445 RepID=A0AA44DC41_STRE0|nr:4-hydroxy-2-oxovalerate aldolase [Streptomyces somaliensis]MCP9946575.1 4-hydroxy-2-oxovalerate aldolase [Streptomyces somaliensis]MCP9973058.1 4-hydroxy-2-oxovalerate aldolase [Streptomyces somaliensis]MCQ0021846.1 4-hydroxy-2-oxovalerate aldolase [Streptomyces somaliensis DSM 40738]NKY13997.1 4-hydroxy-2-oxovalerate aldolase [Streptomyces somaliensis DSM 40738]